MSSTSFRKRLWSGAPTSTRHASDAVHTAAAAAAAAACDATAACEVVEGTVGRGRAVVVPREGVHVVDGRVVVAQLVVVPPQKVLVVDHLAAAVHALAHRGLAPQEPLEVLALQAHQQILVALLQQPPVEHFVKLVEHVAERHLTTTTTTAAAAAAAHASAERHAAAWMHEPHRLSEALPRELQPHLLVQKAAELFLFILYIF
jgi:hypothetical protein